MACWGQAAELYGRPFDTQQMFRHDVQHAALLAFSKTCTTLTILLCRESCMQHDLVLGLRSAGGAQKSRQVMAGSCSCSLGWGRSQIEIRRTCSFVKRPFNPIYFLELFSRRALGASDFARRSINLCFARHCAKSQTTSPGKLETFRLSAFPYEPAASQIGSLGQGWLTILLGRPERVVPCGI